MDTADICPQVHPDELPEAAMHDDSFLHTAGIKANRKRTFTIELGGVDCYALLKFIEETAEQGGLLPRVQAAVLWSVKIRAQLRAQGF